MSRQARTTGTRASRYYEQERGKATIKTALLWCGTYAVAVTIMAGALVAAMLKYR